MRTRICCRPCAGSDIVERIASSDIFTLLFLAAYRAKLLVTPASRARSESTSRNRCDPLEDVRLSSEVSLVLVGGDLFDARTLRRTWPIERDYGPRPWTNDDITRTEVRADDYWDLRR